MPKLSTHFENRKPSSIRMAQILFSQRADKAEAINVSIGNVSLPMHPSMQNRMKNLANSPFADGVVKYSPTVGTNEAQDAFLNIISSSGFDTSKLYCQITEGGSAAMELIIVGVCGDAGKNDNPMLVLDPAYTNYASFASRLGRKIISIKRTLQKNGEFELPRLEDIEALIIKEKPNSLLVIPYDNPTGQIFTQTQLEDLARLCVKYDMWLISDEAYREVYYTSAKPVSIWGVTNNQVAGIEGRRISIETASKVWNACGLRIGAIVTDNKDYYIKSIAENTANLCANVIGQYIFGALAHESHSDLQAWYQAQKDYYKKIAQSLTDGFASLLPELIVSKPDAAMYSVVDVRNLVDDNFDAEDFVKFCASEGCVELNGKSYTLLVAPIADFYTLKCNDGSKQMRISYVETPEKMLLIPKLFKQLLQAYLKAK